MTSVIKLRYRPFLCFVTEQILFGNNSITTLHFLRYQPGGFSAIEAGRALITGRCADVGSITMQQFRGLAARAPYFANGSAKDLRELVDYYDRRFDMKLTGQEKIDLINFLSVL